MMAKILTDHLHAISQQMGMNTAHVIATVTTQADDAQNLARILPEDLPAAVGQVGRIIYSQA